MRPYNISGRLISDGYRCRPDTLSRAAGAECSTPSFCHWETGVNSTVSVAGWLNRFAKASSFATSTNVSDLFDAGCEIFPSRISSVSAFTFHFSAAPSRSNWRTAAAAWRTAGTVRGVVPLPGVNPQTGEPNRASVGMASVEPATGAVRTMIGGPGFEGYQYNLATQNARGVGSSFKTFVLATIMEQGYSPDDIINGLAPCTFKNGRQPDYEVNNFADGSGSMGTITQATLQSSN